MNCKCQEKKVLERKKYGIYKNKKKICTFCQISLKFLCPGNHDEHFLHWTPLLFLRPILSVKTFYKANFKTIYEKGVFIGSGFEKVWEIHAKTPVKTTFSK